jgi:tetratricopeptide (TPR) repeat protein
MISPRNDAHWLTYEDQVFDVFKEHYPNATVQRNVHLVGRFSKRKRQIDILITEDAPSGPLQTVVDTKFFKRKIDVKAVDGFAGFVDDVGAQRGMLITSGGYTRAALKRAFYGPSDLELDILNFAALQKFQGFSAIPYSDEHAFLVPAPFGWVIDSTQGKGFLASMYQRGLDLETAKKKKEFLYINFWKKANEPITAVELDERQVARLRLGGPVEVSHRATVQRRDALTRLRMADVKRYKCLEITGFLEFNDLIFFAVLLTPAESQRPNIRRLESVLRQAVPIQLRRDNTKLIEKLLEQAKQAVSATERAGLLRQVGHWYRDMGQFQEARQALEESLSLDSSENCYWTIRELLPVLAKLGDRSRAIEVMAVLLRLDPHNPTVFNDCFNFAAMWIERTALLTLFDTLKAEKADDQLVQANCDFYSGNLLVHDDLELAKKHFIAARKIFRGVFPRGHYVFGALRRALKEYSR